MLVFGHPDQKEWMFNSNVTEDGRYLVVRAAKGRARTNAVFFKDLSKPGAAVQPLLGAFDGFYDFVDNDGAVFNLTTDNGAP